MRYLSELGNISSRTIIIITTFFVFLTGYGIYTIKATENDLLADDILNGIFELAKEEKERIDPEISENENDDSEINTEESEYKNQKEEKKYVYVNTKERKGYGFKIIEESTPTLIKVQTTKKEIPQNLCKIFKEKFKEKIWKNNFDKVVVVNKKGKEKTNILIAKCPTEKIPALRFYVKFKANKVKIDIKENEENNNNNNYELPPPIQKTTQSSSPTVRRAPVSSLPSRSPSYSNTNCPAGTSTNGLGGMATAGCHCNQTGEFWNGQNCEVKSCPEGSSRNINNAGDKTNISGCKCNPDTPIWIPSKKECVEKCPENKILDRTTGKCLSKAEQDCRWGVCQTCNERGKHQNIIGEQACETAGLNGMCNNNGTCYPIEGKKCSETNECPNGEFCNYGGKYNSSKKQVGKFGNTPNVCQLVNAEEFTYKNITYYYNTENDLKSWCRAANNKANCLWGYLAKPGAESWCASLGKRLLSKNEISKIWSVLKKELPKTYKGYAYWVEEGVWIEDLNGGISFGNGHPDGYGGRGGVVCK